MGFLVSTSLLFTIGLELIFQGTSTYFQSRPHWIDFGVLLPVSLLSMVIDVADVMRIDIGKGAASLLHIFIVLPAFSCLLAYRLYRVVGDKILLADVSYRPKSTESPLDQIESLDFIWTTPDTKSDEWLVDELLGVSDGLVGMHRFVTRESASESNESPSIGKKFNTTFGSRPNFDTIFQDVADKAASRYVM